MTMTLRLYLEQSTKASFRVAWFSEALLIKQLENEVMESLTIKYTRNTFSSTCLLMQKENPGKRSIILSKQRILAIFPLW